MGKIYSSEKDRHFCITTGCSNLCAKKELAEKHAKYGKIAYEVYCYDCANKTRIKISKTPTASTNIKLQKSYRKSYNKISKK